MNIEPIADEVVYGYTNDRSIMPTWYSRSFDEILKAAKEESANWKKPYYILEVTRHYEVCGFVEEGESWLVSMPNDNPVNIYIRQGENNNAK